MGQGILLKRESEPLAITAIGERFQGLRIVDPSAERTILNSMRQYGQLTPVVVCRLESGSDELLDGFKRLRAARSLAMRELAVSRLEVGPRGCKAAILQLNRVGRNISSMEEALVVHSLCHDDGLSQVEIAGLLGRHKSWVNRRLAMWERLAEPAKEELRLGLLSPTMARQLTRLPVGNQAEALATAREAALSSAELSGVVDLLLASSTGEQKALVLREPRRALRQAQGSYVPPWDPRLSTAGNRAARQLAALLDRLAKMHSWLRYSGRGELQACDRELIRPGFERLLAETAAVREATQDFVAELQQP